MDINQFIGDLKYELRMLLGASAMVELLTNTKTGNIINYFKDSVYMHSRNLYNFFASNTRNDARITDYGFNGIAFNLSVYNKWIGALHNHVLHIKSARVTPNNVVAGEHLNEQTKVFADDIVTLWEAWVNSVSDPTINKLLHDTLVNAQQEASDDCDRARKLFAL